MSGFGVLGILTGLFMLAGSPGRNTSGQLFSIAPRQPGEDSCGQSVAAALTGRFPDAAGEMSLLDMEKALLDSGIQSRPVELRLEELLPIARRNYPVIILLSKPAWHYVLLIGESSGTAVIADPSEGTIAHETARLSERFSGWAIVPLLDTDTARDLAARLEPASRAALRRVSIIRRRLDLEITGMRPDAGTSSRIRMSVSQSLSIGRGLRFMAEVSSLPFARLELGYGTEEMGISLEAFAGLLFESTRSGTPHSPQAYAKAAGAYTRDPFAYYLGITCSENLEGRAGLLYAVNDRTAFEAGLSMEAAYSGCRNWSLDMTGGIHMALGEMICSISASSPLEGSGGSVTVALNF